MEAEKILKRRKEMTGEKPVPQLLMSKVFALEVLK